MEDFAKKTFTCGHDFFEKKESLKRGTKKSVVTDKKAATGNLQNFIPQPGDKLKEVCLNFHFFQKDDGSHNFSQSDLPRIHQMVVWLNDKFANIQPSSISVNSGNIVVITDTRIRFKLHRCEFYQDSTLESSNNANVLKQAVIARDPKMLEQLNIYFTNGNYFGAIGYSVLPHPTNMQLDSFVWMTNAHNVHQVGPGADHSYVTIWIAHEIGHALDLCHTYSGGGCSANCNTNTTDYLSDVFGTNPSSCPFPQGYSNNLMAGGNANHWISGLQAAKMNRALEEKSVSRYVSKKNDIVVWRPSDGGWYIKGVFGPFASWGLPNDIPVPADYNGDGIAQIAVWRPSDGTWRVQGQPSVQWGTGGDIPLPGNYTRVGWAQFVVWRPSNGTWYIKGKGIKNKGAKNVKWGQGGDIPVPADYDGNGKLNIAVWRPSDGTWRIKGQPVVQWGQAGDIPVPGDYNGDGSAQIAVWRPSDGTWRVHGQPPIQWGQGGDIPLTGDFIGCKKNDQMVIYRPSDGKWYIKDSPNNSFPEWGIGGDIPVLGRFI